MTTRPRRLVPITIALAALLAAGCAAAKPARHTHAHTAVKQRAHAARPATPPNARASDPLRGHASFYAPHFHGRRTASGDRYDAARFTAAHRTLPFGTQVQVTNTRNLRTVVVHVNDRGPMRPGRVIDLSRAAAAELGILHSGWAPVTIRIAAAGDAGSLGVPARESASDTAAGDGAPTIAPRPAGEPGGVEAMGPAGG